MVKELPGLVLQPIRRSVHGYHYITMCCHSPKEVDGESGLLAITRRIGPAHLKMMTERGPEWRLRRMATLHRLLELALRREYTKQLVFKKLGEIAAKEIPELFFRSTPLQAYLQEKGKIRG